MSSVFGGSSVPSAASPPSGPTTAEIAQARVEAQRRRANQQGRSSTILGGSLSDNVQTKTLLGG